jgi:threonine-phosphate decarboxylase
MRSYEHGGDIYRNSVRLDFSVSLNPLGMPAGVLQALRENLDVCRNYPDPFCEQLRLAIARHEGVPYGHIVCGAGAADIIHRLVFAQKPKKALVCAPAFSEYERAVLLSGGQVMYHDMSEDDEFCLTERVLDDISPDVGMVFLCSPNNPTGRLIDAELLAAVSDSCQVYGAALVVDECFLPFTSAESLKSLPHVLVLKAFTKIFSMAGLRLGYMLNGDSAIISSVRDYAQAWSVSSLAQIAGVAALEDCPGWMKRTIETVKTEREYLTMRLRGLELKVYDSDANFILIHSEKPLYEPLLKQGILVRNCANFKGLGENYIRIAVKLRDENDELIEKIGRIA